MKYAILISIMIGAMNIMMMSQDNKIRTVRDNVGFCWDASEMNSFMSFLDNQKIEAPAVDGNLIAAISPHDDYLYAGRVYSPLYKMIKAKEVVIFGVTHGTVRKEINDPSDIIILDDFPKWKGTFSDVEISPLREKIKKELNPKYFRTDDKAHLLEHSIEAEIPFLQYYNRDIKITPIMVTKSSYEHLDSLSSELSNIFLKYISENKLVPGKDIFFLISNDANHYGEDFSNSPYGLDADAHLKATTRDKEIAATHFNGVITREEIKSLSNDLFPDESGKKITPLWCGRYPIVLGLLSVEKTIKSLIGKELYSKVISYSDSWSEGVLSFARKQMGITAPFSLKHWVGYLSAGFYLK